MVHELTHTPTPDSDPLCGPVRTCVGCRERAAKSELLRIVVESRDGGQAVLTPDPGGSAAGRGAYLHRRIACFELAVRRRAFPRALRLGVGVETTAIRDHVIQQVTPAVHNPLDT